MYKEHPAFTSPPADAVLWRYIDFTKFLSLLQEQALFFARADRLGDPFEGSFSKANIALRPTIYNEHHEKFSAQLANFAFQSRRFTLVNCWHESPHESEAMWRLYGSAGGSLAIRSDCKSLVDSLADDDDVYIGRVTYVDYNHYFIPESNTFFPYLHKRHSFQHEREVRAVMQKLPTDTKGALAARGRSPRCSNGWLKGPVAR